MMKTMKNMVKQALMGALTALIFPALLTACGSEDDLLPTATCDTTFETAAGRVIDLSLLSGDFIARDGDIITGTLKGQYRITVNTPNAVVTLRDVNITNLTEGSDWPGISCLNHTTLVIEGTSSVMSGLDNGDDWQHPGACNNPGIWIAPDKTLTIRGTGTLYASPKVNGAITTTGSGIGGGYELPCGNIRIESGHIHATGMGGCSAIGGGLSGYNREATCGTITVNTPYVTAKATEGVDTIGAGSPLQPPRTGGGF